MILLFKWAILLASCFAPFMEGGREVFMQIAEPLGFSQLSQAPNNEQLQQQNYASFIGTYRGPATVSSLPNIESRGMVEYKIVSIDEAGKVTMKVKGYNGLVGEGEASGQLSGNTVNFSGKLNIMGYLWNLSGRYQYDSSGNKIHGRYDLSYRYGAAEALQEGQFEAEKRF